jgi:tRNA-dihydrouridine synthase A
VKRIRYLKEELKEGQRLHHVIRHILGLYQGLPGARHWRGFLSQNGNREGVDERLLLEAGELVGS